MFLRNQCVECSIGAVVRAGLCISCGACAGLSNSVKMVERVNRGQAFPEPVDACGPLANDVCPGKGYPIVRLGDVLFGNSPRDAELGRVRQVAAMRSLDAEIVAGATSGGAMTAIGMHLLETGRVQGVVVTGMRYGPPGPRGHPHIATTRHSLLAAQGSKYCPVPVLELLPQMERFEGKLAFIGTPCEVAALRLLQERRQQWSARVSYCLSNFCGGFRDLRETDALIRGVDQVPEQVVSLHYRGGGQPGRMRIEDNTGHVEELPYPAYARRTGVPKHLRCRLCTDATGELADFSCGDAWIPRFLNSGHAWSIVLARSEMATGVLTEMASENKVTVATVDVEEVRSSQFHNLLSKKRRQASRRRLYRLMGQPLPDLPGSYAATESGTLIELSVHIQHRVLEVLERAGLYPAFARILRRF